jgi:catechol 2,3-dioxygenase-like lactoylglutathione lyase family enzyme
MALRSINLVTVPVTDQDRAKAFYVDTLGFTVKLDYVMTAEEAGAAGPRSRWLTLTPPGGGTDITLVTWFGDTSPPGSAKLSIACDDVDATYGALTARGAKPNNTVEDAPWGRWFGIDDPDGNNWLVVQERYAA